MDFKLFLELSVVSRLGVATAAGVEVKSTAHGSAIVLTCPFEYPAVSSRREHGITLVIHHNNPTELFAMSPEKILY
jgi:hypothetical protein